MKIVMQGLWRLLSARRRQAKPAPKTSNDKGTNFEVERKFRLKPEELDAVKQRLADMGFSLSQRIEMTDRFLPVKVDGEMLRVRDETVAGKTHTVLTMKEWVIVSGGKERSETEGHLSPLSRAFLLFLGRLIRGRALLQFSKLRLDHTSPGHAHVIVALDEVEGLGVNSGHYAEIEVLVPQNGDVESARAEIVSLARRLFNEEREPVKQSYMDMLKLVS
ncbi:MAG: CYTH domain-containing protein [Cyanobacteria bacterium SZAS LIN-2]|nr:CYTH domain-containing protein [Cyanobacteria bacterium SZAS LIN-2]